MCRLRHRLWVDVGHHVATHRISEQSAHQHCGSSLRLEVSANFPLLPERAEVITQVARGHSREIARALRHFGSLFDLAHRLTDDRSTKSQMLHQRLAPHRKLTLRIDGSFGKGRYVRRLGEIDRKST